MTEALHKIAQQDTPEWADVPKNKWGFIAWVMVRLGGWGVLILVLLYFGKRQYEESRADKLEIIAAYRQQIEVNTRLLSVLGNVEKTMEELAREARAAHRYAGPVNNQ
jgi:hypothetical protein